MSYAFRKRQFMFPVIPNELKDLEEARRLILNISKTLNDMVQTLGDVYVNRGEDSNVNDWVVGDLTTDGTYRDLDCSAIVPDGAKAIIFRVALIDDAADSMFAFRKNGAAVVTTNNATVNTYVAGVVARAQLTVPCDVNRVVEYYASNTVWTTINIVIMGWIM